MTAGETRVDRSRLPIAPLCAGLISHSIILVPFSAWQLTHRKHHKNTGNIDNDEIFAPGAAAMTCFQESRL
jgi:fatty acid desaturase